MKITNHQDDPRNPNVDNTKKDKPLYTPDPTPKNPGYDDNDSSTDKRHPHQEGPVPGG